MIQYITMALSICSLACSIALFASVLWCSPKRSLKRSLKRHQKETKSEDTDEVWVDDKGKHYNIDRTPIDWKKVAEGRDK